MRKRFLLTGLIGLSLVITACGGRGSLSGKGKESGNSLDSMIASKEAEETKGGSENSIIAVLPDSSPVEETLPSTASSADSAATYEETSRQEDVITETTSKAAGQSSEDRAVARENARKDAELRAEKFTELKIIDYPNWEDVSQSYRDKGVVVVDLNERLHPIMTWGSHIEDNPDGMQEGIYFDGIDALEEDLTAYFKTLKDFTIEECEDVLYSHQKEASDWKDIVKAFPVKPEYDAFDLHNGDEFNLELNLDTPYIEELNLYFNFTPKTFIVGGLSLPEFKDITEVELTDKQLQALLKPIFYRKDNVIYAEPNEQAKSVLGDYQCSIVPMNNLKVGDTVQLIVLSYDTGSDYFISDSATLVYDYVVEKVISK